MQITNLFANKYMTVADYRCDATPSDRPFAESHAQYSLSFVRKGSFGCRVCGKFFELVPGSFLVGCPDDEYICTHEHHCNGDECLSFSFNSKTLDILDVPIKAWHAGAIGPTSKLIVVGQLAQLTAYGQTSLSFEEAGFLLAKTFLETISDQKLTFVKGSAQTRRRIIETANRIAICSRERLTLDEMASWAELSPFHFLRLFSQLLGLTPHQYLIRSRIGQAVRHLTADTQPVTEIAFEVGFDDLSNFVRTFRRAAGISPREFRRMTKSDRQLVEAHALQGRLSAATIKLR